MCILGRELRFHKFQKLCVWSFLVFLECIILRKICSFELIHLAPGVLDKELASLEVSDHISSSCISSTILAVSNSAAPFGVAAQSSSVSSGVKYITNAMSIQSYFISHNAYSLQQGHGVGDGCIEGIIIYCVGALYRGVPCPEYCAVYWVWGGRHGVCTAAV